MNNHIPDTDATMGRAPELGAAGPGHQSGSADLAQTSQNQGTAAERECGWKCGDRAPGHGHFTVIVRETTGKLLGRLGGDGMTTHRKVHAAILSRARAEHLAKDIMARHQDLTATVRPF